MSSNVQITGSDANLKLQWDNVLNVVTDLGVHGVAAAFGLTPSPGNIASFISKLKGVVKAEEPLESQAWTLVALCFASAIDELRPLTSDGEVRKAARKTLTETKIIIEEKRYFLTPEFFTNPISLPLYQDVREKFVEALGKLWPDGHKIGGKLDSAFNCALYDIIRHDPDMFEPLRVTVSGAGLEAKRLEDDWIAYRERLKHTFHVKPVFGQEETLISLAQLYISPRAIWHEIRTNERDEEKRIAHLAPIIHDGYRI